MKKALTLLLVLITIISYSQPRTIIVDKITPPYNADTVGAFKRIDSLIASWKREKIDSSPRIIIHPRRWDDKQTRINHINFEGSDIWKEEINKHWGDDTVKKRMDSTFIYLPKDSNYFKAESIDETFEYVTPKGNLLLPYFEKILKNIDRYGKVKNRKKLLIAIHNFRVKELLLNIQGISTIIGGY